MPPKIMPHAQAQALFNKQNGGGKKPISDTRETALRQMHLRFENWVAYLRANGNDGKIILPLPPAITNGYLSRAHYSVKGDFQKSYCDQCDAILMTGLIPKPGVLPPDFIRCEILVCSAMAMDRDGANARVKWPQDWLKARGYIKDDSDKYYEAIFLPPAVVPRKEVRVEFTFL